MHIHALAATLLFAPLCGCVLPSVLPGAPGSGLQGVSEERAGLAPALQTQVRMVFPAAFSTVGEAAGYLLAPHDYRPAPGAADAAVAARPLMTPHSIEPVSLYLALQRLLGDDGQIVLDQEQRLFLFRVRGLGEASVAFAALAGLARPAPVAAVAPPSRRKNPAPVAAIAPPSPRQDPAPVATIAPLPRRKDPAPAVAVAPPLPRKDPAPAVAVAPPLPRQVPAPAVAVAPPSPPPRKNIGPVQAAPRPASAESCDAIQFKRRVMLSRIVKDYLSQCGFTEVSWKIGKPGSYTDYRILQDAKVPLPERHKDLIELLQVRFGIKTRIHDDNRIDFYDEKSLL